MMLVKVGGPFSPIKIHSCSATMVEKRSSFFSKRNIHVLLSVSITHELCTKFSAIEKVKDPLKSLFQETTTVNIFHIFYRLHYLYIYLYDAYTQTHTQAYT